MLTKRMATVAIFSGVLAKMAHADNPKPPGDGMTLPTPNGAEIDLWNKPMTWTVNLDQMKSLDVVFGGKKVSITSAELFAALQS